MFTEKTPYEEMSRAIHKCVELPLPKHLRDRLTRARLSGERYIFYRDKVPGSEQPVLIVRYVYVKLFSPVLVLDGREGNGYAWRNSQGGVTMLESHAIRRYFNRHEHMPEVKHLDEIEPKRLREVTHRMIVEADKAVTCFNDTKTAEECYYDGGMFNIDSDEKNCRYYTYVMNRQAFPDQRLRSLRSEKHQEEKRRMLQDKELERFMGSYGSYMEKHGWK